MVRIYRCSICGCKCTVDEIIVVNGKIICSVCRERYKYNIPLSMF